MPLSKPLDGVNKVKIKNAKLCCRQWNNYIIGNSNTLIDIPDTDVLVNIYESHLTVYINKLKTNNGVNNSAVGVVFTGTLTFN